MATSRLEDDPLMIQGRSRTGTWSNTWTVSKDAGFQITDAVPPIVASLPNFPVNGECPWSFKLDDVPVTDIVSAVNDNPAFDGHAHVYRYGNNAVVTYPNKQARVDLTVLNHSKYGCILGIAICLTPSQHGGGDKVVGHLGTPDGTPENDWPMKDPTQPPFTIPDVSQGIINRIGTQWGIDNWCVLAIEDALITEDFDEFNHCDTMITMPDLPEVEACKQACCADPADETTCKTGALLDCYVAGGPEDDTCVDQTDILDALNEVPVEVLETNEDPDPVVVIPPPTICLMNDLHIANPECPESPVAVYKSTTDDSVPPPENIFYDFDFDPAGEKIKFKLWHDIGQTDALDLDVFVEYKRHIAQSNKVGDWHCARFELECTPTDTDPTTPTEINAVCTPGNPNSYTVVTVSYVLKGTNDVAVVSTGGDVDECCDADTTGMPVVKYTYVINCDCPNGSSNTRLLALDSDTLVEDFRNMA